jgi:parallel beta-helix repeat protein
VIHGLGFWRLGAVLGVLASCGAAVGLAGPATAAAKVTSLTSCQDITAPGDYRLDADVSGANGATCFSIDASDVTLNLNGHTITGTAIYVAGPNAKIVGPGTVTDAGTGIELNGGSGSLRGVTVTDGAPNSNGIYIDSSGNTVRGNVATDNPEAGIFIESPDTGNTVIGNYAHGNGTDLEDQSGGCTNNVWRGNDFGTADPTCIR